MDGRTRHRRKQLLALAMWLCASSFMATGGEKPVKARVDWKKTHQRIVGFGGTMGWIHPKPEKRKEVFDLLFKDLGVSVLRVRALGGEEGDESCPEPENDNDDPNSIDLSRFHFSKTEKLNAIFIKAAHERGVKTIIPAAWSPPGWMKDTGTRAGGGRLKEDMREEFAELWVAYVKAMRRHFNIDITMLSIQNEPDLTYYYPTCRFDEEHYAATVDAVRRRLARENLKVRVLGPDTCRIYNLPEYVKAMREKKLIDGSPILTHLYDLSIPYQDVHRDADRWKTAWNLARRNKCPLWMMETANYLSHGITPASYEEALIWAQKIHWALVEGNCEVVCYWALFFDKKGESIIFKDPKSNDPYLITPKFYTFKNYARFVRPGMVRVSAKCGDEKILLSAFRMPDDAASKRVVVIVNPTETPRKLTLEKSTCAWHRYVTTEQMKCQRMEGEERLPTYALPPRSVTTLVSVDNKPDRSAGSQR